VSASRRALLALAGLLALAAAWAWSNRFVQDDAYISCTYARHWVEGHGLVFNPGERVEGYTNFLWTLLLALPIRAGWDPAAFACGAGLAAFALTLLLAHRLAGLLAPRTSAGLWAVFLLGANYTFSAYATGGLETQWQTLLVTAAAAVAFAAAARGAWGPAAFALFSLLAALAVLMRLDSLVLLAVPAVLAAAAAWRGRNWRAAACLAGPFALLVGPWLAWKWHFYGALLPNTFHAKTGGAVWLRGLYYAGSFFVAYLLVVPLAIHLLRLRRDAREVARASAAAPLPHRALLLAHLPPILWLAYVVAVGGDFMEYRFLVPMLPLLMVLLAGSLCASRWRWAVAAALLAASGLHARTFDASPLKRGMASVPELRRCVTGRGNWCELGAALGRAFGPGDRPSIAVTPAGALPYFSRLRTVDMLGLNDPWVARHGARLSDRAGHRRIATVAYLRARGVNLVIGHPTLVPRSRARPAYAADDRHLRQMFVFRPLPDPESLPRDACVVEIPVGADDALLAIYLTPHPAVEDRIRAAGWRVVPLAAGPPPPAA
jgi:arabinofuranosyltransferase